MSHSIKVAVAGCAQWAWIESSRIMGETLRQAIGEGAESHVHVPVDRAGLLSVLENANYLIIHTHGSPEGLFDQREDGRQTTIATLANIRNFPRFRRLLLVVMTACSAAGGENEKNIACELSRHINPKGLVIANRYVTWGSHHDFGERNGKKGWVAYQNGELVLREEDIPAAITMADAYRIFAKHCSFMQM